MSGQNDRQLDWLKTLARVGTIGTDMVVFAGIGFWLGQKADERWGTLFGFVAGFWSVSRRISNWR